MKTLLTSLFGSYIPLCDAEGVPFEGIASVDFEYILGVALFAIVLVSVFGIIRTLVKNV